jgi:predicted Fe-Mo cluster-binding NifX family protein
MSSVRLAVPTNGKKGMKDTVSNVFARAPIFTIIDVVDGEVQEIRIEENTASGLKQGTGPIIANSLKEKGVNAVVACELGPGAKILLELSDIKLIFVEPSVKVKDAVTEALSQLLQVV